MITCTNIPYVKWEVTNLAYQEIIASNQHRYDLFANGSFKTQLT